MTNAEKDNDIKIFDNALDKACKILADMARQSPCCINDCPSESEKDCHVKCRCVEETGARSSKTQRLG